MSLFWKQKSVAPSTDSTTPILDAPIQTDEASSLNSHPVLAASNPTQSSSRPSDSLIDFSDDTHTPANNLQSSIFSDTTMTTTSVTPGESIHSPPDTIVVESEKAQLTPTQQKRRSFFGFGKKRQPSGDDTGAKQPTSPTSVPPITTTSPPETRTGAGTNSTTSPVSPVRSSHFGSQRRSKTGSPRLSTSSIFERNVQDPSLPPGSPCIPSHFSTENYIPAVLEATSLAITDSSVDPDRVEIVSSTSHHPVLSHHPETYSNPWAEESVHSGDESIGHGYNSSLASADKRRLSFISFADVVQAENEQASHSSTNLDSSQPKQATASLRSNSPVRTPPQLPHSPPGTGLGLSDFSMEKDMSIPDRQIGKGTAVPHNEVTVETLSQALRKHGSTDLKASVKGQGHAQHGLSMGSGSEFDNPWRD